MVTSRGSPVPRRTKPWIFCLLFSPFTLLKTTNSTN